MSSAIEIFCATDATKAKGGLNVQDIKDELKKRGLPTNGSRADLRERLCASVKSSKSQKPQKPQRS